MRLIAWIPAYAGMTGNEMPERIQSDPKNEPRMNPSSISEKARKPRARSLRRPQRIKMPQMSLSLSLSQRHRAKVHDNIYF